ncbi:MAG: hypothetical protein QF492_08400 [Candidatus Krumholzibacteria bacterium]|nr:hypothetical protein [Candidatus Krumholzibacteria bacterium]
MRDSVSGDGRSVRSQPFAPESRSKEEDGWADLMNVEQSEPSLSPAGLSFSPELSPAAPSRARRSPVGQILSRSNSTAG